MSDMTVAQYLEENFWKETAAMKKYNGRKTGFGNLDESEFFWFLPGLYVLGGTPGAGKTSWALQLVCQLSAGVADCESESCVFVSYEISRLKLIAKILARETRIEYDKAKRQGTASNVFPLSASAIFCGTRSPEFEKAVESCRRKLDNLIILDADADMTIDKLIEKLRMMAKAAGDKNFVCVVDYLQLIPVGKSDKSETSKERLDGVLFKLKKFQKETDATVVVISSFNRSSNVTGNGDMHSYLGSGGIEYTADVCMTLARAKTNNDETPKPPPYEVHLKCTKNRHGGLFNEKFSYWAQSDYFCKFEASTSEEPSVKKKIRK